MKILEGEQEERQEEGQERIAGEMVRRKGWEAGRQAQWSREKALTFKSRRESLCLRIGSDVSLPPTNIIVSDVCELERRRGK